MSEDIRFEIDPDQVKFSDQKRFRAMQNGASSTEDQDFIVEFLDRVVIGGVDDYPLRLMIPMVQAAMQTVALGAEEKKS